MVSTACTRRPHSSSNRNSNRKVRIAHPRPASAWKYEGAKAKEIPPRSRARSGRNPLLRASQGRPQGKEAACRRPPAPPAPRCAARGFTSLRPQRPHTRPATAVSGHLRSSRQRPARCACRWEGPAQHSHFKRHCAHSLRSLSFEGWELERKTFRGRGSSRCAFRTCATSAPKLKSWCVCASKYI